MKAENKAFRQELNQEKAETREKAGSQENDSHEKRKPGILDPLSPSKRKHSSDSIDSMDSNRASLGSGGDDRNMSSNPFADQQDENGAGTELTEMSGPEFARSASVESSGVVHNYAPFLPAKKPASMENTSATMTPSTIAENGDPENSRMITTEVVELKSPEMKERARPPSFIGMPPSSSEQKQPPSLMDLDILEHQE